MSERADPKNLSESGNCAFRQPKVNLTKRKLQIIVKNQHQAEEISALSIALIGFKDSSQICVTMSQIVQIPTALTGKDRFCAG